MKLVFFLTSVIILITSEAAKHHSAYRYQDRGCAPDSEFQHLRRLLAVHGEEAPINQSSLLHGEEEAKIESSSKTLVHGCWDLLITQLLAQFNSGVVAGDFLPGGDLGGYCCNFPYGVCQAETNEAPALGIRIYKEFRGVNFQKSSLV